jgi:hypothetical protein
MSYDIKHGASSSRQHMMEYLGIKPKFQLFSKSSDVDISHSTIGGAVSELDESPKKGGNTYAPLDQDIDSFREPAFLMR